MEELELLEPEVPTRGHLPSVFEGVGVLTKKTEETKWSLNIFLR